MYGPFRSLRTCAGAIVLIFLLRLFTASASAQEGGDAYYEQNCSSCHSIGGGFLAGPDLKDVTQRAERRWLLEFIRDPEKKIAAKDAYALKLREQSHGMAMPAFPDLSDKLGDEVLRYIEFRSTGSHPQPEITSAAGDPEIGRALFIGTRQLSGGGAACMACHQAAALPGTGGKLGPDLTLVRQRLGGERGLSAWLQRPPTPVMSSIYRDKALSKEEIADLIAFFGTTLEHSEQARETPRRAVQLAGIGVSLLAMLVAGFVWRGRSRGVRVTITKRGDGK